MKKKIYPFRDLEETKEIDSKEIESILKRRIKKLEDKKTEFLKSLQETARQRENYQSAGDGSYSNLLRDELSEYFDDDGFHEGFFTHHFDFEIKKARRVLRKITGIKYTNLKSHDNWSIETIIIRSRKYGREIPHYFWKYKKALSYHLRKHENGWYDLWNRREELLDLVERAEKELKSKKEKELIMITLPVLPKELKIIISEFYYNSLDHEKVTKLRLKKWKDFHWPYNYQEREEIDDVLKNVRSTKYLSEIIKTYENEIEDNLEDIFLILSDDLLEFNKDKAASAIADAWKSCSTIRTFKEKRKEAREQEKKDVNVLLDKLREKQEKIEKLENQLNNLQVQEQISTQIKIPPYN